MGKGGIRYWAVQGSCLRGRGRYKGRVSSYGQVTNGEGRHQVLGCSGLVFGGSIKDACQVTVG